MGDDELDCLPRGVPSVMVVRLSGCLVLVGTREVRQKKERTYMRWSGVWHCLFRQFAGIRATGL